jgi:hypothetical protein
VTSHPASQRRAAAVALSTPPLNPTTIFKPSDAKAECLTTVTINNTIEFRWYYRSNSSKTWISCYNWSERALFAGEYHYAGYLLIAGHWPELNYPRAYEVEVYLDIFEPNRELPCAKSTGRLGNFDEFTAIHPCGRDRRVFSLLI